MTDIQEYRGTWWLPTNEEHTVGGIGTVSPQFGFKLETFEPLSNDLSDNMSTTTVDLIHGISTEGDKITLRECLRQSTSIAVGKRLSGTSSFLAKESYIGNKILDTPAFDSIELQIQLLENWFENSGISFGGKLVHQNTNSLNEFELNYNTVDPIVVSLNDLTLSIGTTANMNIDRVGGGRINESVVIKIEENGNKSRVNDLRELIYSLTYFFAFALREPVQIRDIKGINEEVIDGDNTKEKFDVYLPLKSETDVSDTLNPSSVNFYQSDIDNLEKVLKAWDACLDDFGNSFYYYLMTFYYDLPIEIKELLVHAAISEYYMYVTHQSDPESAGYNPIDPSTASTYSAFSGARFVDMDVPFEEAVSHIISKHDSIFKSDVLDFDSFVELANSADNTSTETLDTYYFSVAVLEGALLSEIGIPNEQIVANLDARRKGF